MVFSMPVFVAVRSLTAALLLMLGLNSHAAERFYIDNAAISKIGNGYSLNATIHYPLSPRVIEALENGVPITFLQHFRLREPFPVIGEYVPWNWRETRWSTVISYQLRYHALSEQYILLAMDTHKRRNFPSLTSALNTLGKVERLNLPPEHDIDPNTMILEIQSELDIHALPTPMRPGALISDKWQIASPWVAASWP
jgi:hypothetical protein